MCAIIYLTKSDIFIIVIQFILFCSVADWEFGANQFVRMLPDKVIIHCK